MLPRQWSLISALFRGRGFRAGLATLVAGSAIATGALLSNLGGAPRVAVAPPMQLTTSGLPGYWLVASDGGIFPFGAARGLGSTGGTPLNRPIVGMTSTPDGGGYWLVASDGGIFPFGDAGGYGSTGGMHLNQPIVGMASTPSGHGYWLVARDGGIFPFGDAGGYGSTGGMHLNQPIVGMASTPGGHGYWLLASDGGIFPFGDAGGYGSTGGMTLNQPIVGMAAASDGHGYWLVARDGGIFPFGSAPGLGSTGGMHLNQPIVGMAAATNGHGYWLVASDGGIFPFGTAAGLGSTGGIHLNQPIVGMAASPVAVPLYSLIASSTDKVQADGVSTARITVGVVAAPFVGVADDPISFSVSPSGCGTMSPDATATNVNGLLTATYTAGTATQDCSVRATEQLVGTSAVAKITQTASQPASISASPSTATSVTADQGATGTPVTFTVLDRGGHPVPSAALDLSVSLPHGSVAPTTASSDSQGRITANVTDTVAGDSGAAIATVHGQGISGQTGNLTITPGAAHTLVFAAQPSNTQSTSPITPAVQVAVDDAHGNLVTSSAAGITLALGANPGAGTLSGTLTKAAANGVASFSNLSIDKVGTGYTLTAAGSGLAGATSGTFNITVGPVTHLGFSVQPTSTQSAAHITPSVTVQELDAGGNLVTTATDNVTLAIVTNPSGGTLSGTKTNAGSAGVATFSDLAVDKAGIGYTLGATSGSLTAATSDPFDITPGAASKLVFTTQPAGASGGTAMTTQPVVTVEDAAGNTVTGDASAVSLAITPATNTAGGTLTCTTNPLNASAGVAAFSGCRVDKAANGYTLTASDGLLSPATSSAFNVVVGPAAHLAFTTQPASSTGGTAPATQPVVALSDAGGNPTTNDTSAVSLAITTGSGTTGAALTCTTNPLNATAGVAHFAGCKVDKAGNGYTLTATDGSLPPAVSSAFNITVGPKTQLGFSVQPSNTVAGQVITPAVEVQVQDAGGNLVTTATDGIALAIGNNTGTSGAVLSGTTSKLATAGKATFSDLSIDKAGSGYTLVASNNALQSGTSTAFPINSGAVTHIAFTGEPANTTGGVPIPGVKVSELDSLGNVVTSAADSITVSLGTNPGNAGTLSGTKTKSAVGGVAAFGDLTIDKAANGYTLHATGAGFNTDSTSFNVGTGVGAKLAFTTQPGNGTGGTPLATQPVVTVEDAGGNVASGDSSSVTLAITSGTGTGGANLSCTSNPKAAAAGVATFAGCKVDKAGSGYTLTATDSSLTAAVSSPFTITFGPATQLVFTTAPGNGTGGTALGTQPVVTVEDAGGNTVTSNNGTVGLAITSGTGTGGAVLTCNPSNNQQTVASGVATFTGCAIDKVGNGYTLTASGAPLPTVASPAFNITAGPKAQLVFSTQPGNGTGGTALSTQPVVTIQDAGGNTATGDTSSVTLTITPATNIGGAKLACNPNTNTKAAVAGVATFTGCSIDKAANGYKLTATDGTPSIDSNPFNVTVGPAFQVVFTTQPGGTSTGGSAFGTQPIVTVDDAGGNKVTTDSSQVLLAITANTGTAGANLTCTANPQSASSGAATFAGCKIDKAGTNYTLTATDGTLVSAESNPFTVNVGSPAKLAFIAQPSNTNVNAAITPAVTVAVEDAGGNQTATTDSVTLALNSTPGGANLNGTVTHAAVSGLATFSGLSIDQAGKGDTLTASATGLTSGASASFSIFGAATQVVFSPTDEPTDTAMGQTMKAVKVLIEDSAGNLLTSTNNGVSLTLNHGTLTTNTTLGGTTTQFAVNGVATFSDLHIDQVDTGYTLTAHATSLNPGTSTTFNILP